MEKKHAFHLEKIKREILSQCDKIDIIENVSMSKYTSFRAGGEVAALIEVNDKNQLMTVLSVIHEHDVPHMMLGNGSNTLFKDSGYDGVVVKLGEGFGYAKLCDDASTLEIGQECEVACGASMLLSTLARFFMENSLTGFEFASGIPGTLGGALYMNAGAYGGEIKQIVKYVRAISPDGSEEKIFTAEEMEFGYRHSALEENQYIAIEAVIRLKKGERYKISEEMKELMTKRNSKQPVNYPSAGSTFKRPEGHFAGKLIEEAGMRGVSVGGAQVSTLHCGFIINKDNATATDILQLIKLIQNRVYDETGVMLKPEVRIIG